MNEQRIYFLIISAVGITTAYFLKVGVNKVSREAIEQKKLNIGIYRLFPVEGEQASRLAKS